jgi:hypothetical protein
MGTVEGKTARNMLKGQVLGFWRGEEGRNCEPGAW